VLLNTSGLKAIGAQERTLTSDDIADGAKSSSPTA